MAIRSKNNQMAYLKDENDQTVQGLMADFYGTSSDAKPTENIVNGSTFQEVDTGDFYFFNESTSAWVKKNSGGGGSNPNRVEVIQGTLANPFGGINVSELFLALSNGNASAKILIDASVIGVENVPPVFITDNDEVGFVVTGGYGASEVLYEAYIIIWGPVTGNCSMAVIYTGDVGSDILSYASLIPTTLTIYWHPMPEE